MKHYLTLITLILIGTLRAQTCDPDSIVNHQIRASVTDPSIPWELYKHYAWYNPTCSSNGALLLHLVGTYDNPAKTTRFPQLAANNGFHAVVLKYPNSTSAQSPCRNSADTNCYENFRKEIIEGFDYSNDIAVDSANSIYNRLLKLLSSLHSQQPAEGWDAYYSGNSILWNKVMISGHSQGGGHAAMIAMTQNVQRVIMFASPNDYSDYLNDAAPWTSKPHATAKSSYYSFGNLYDDIVDFSEQHLQWNYLGLHNFGDTINVGTTNWQASASHQLYTTDTGSALGYNHSNMIHDSLVPLDSMGVPKYENVWKYLLGIPLPNTGLETLEKAAIELFPNPFSNTTTLTIHHADYTGCKLQILTVTGQLVKTVDHLESHQIRIDRNDLNAGVYIYFLSMKNQIIQSGKLLVK